MEEPEPWLSPERTAWAAMVVPWFMACERRIRCAHAGGLPVGLDGAAAGSALAPQTVPMVELPPVLRHAERIGGVAEVEIFGDGKRLDQRREGDA